MCNEVTASTTLVDVFPSSVEGYRAVYTRASQRFDELALGRADGRYRKLLAAYAPRRSPRH